MLLRRDNSLQSRLQHTSNDLKHFGIHDTVLLLRIEKIDEGEEVERPVEIELGYIDVEHNCETRRPESRQMPPPFETVRDDSETSRFVFEFLYIRISMNNQ
jgi:hypothetical protein